MARGQPPSPTLSSGNIPWVWCPWWSTALRLAWKLALSYELSLDYQVVGLFQPITGPHVHLIIKPRSFSRWQCGRRCGWPLPQNKQPPPTPQTRTNNSCSRPPGKSGLRLASSKKLSLIAPVHIFTKFVHTSSTCPSTQFWLFLLHIFTNFITANQLSSLKTVVHKYSTLHPRTAHHKLWFPDFEL
jgi:hypothetical protein